MSGKVVPKFTIFGLLVAARLLTFAACSRICCMLKSFVAEQLLEYNNGDFSLGYLEKQW
jgi:hypothetical protein